MKFLAGEDVDSATVERIRGDAHQVFYVAEMEPGISDEEVIRKANQEPALLLTADKDYGELVFRHGRLTQGVVLIRLAGLSAKSKAEIVLAAIREHADDLQRNFCVISSGSVRIRKK